MHQRGKRASCRDHPRRASRSPAEDAGPYLGWAATATSRSLLGPAQRPRRAGCPGPPAGDGAGSRAPPHRLRLRRRKAPRRRARPLPVADWGRMALPHSRAPGARGAGGRGGEVLPVRERGCPSPQALQTVPTSTAARPHKSCCPFPQGRLLRQPGRDSSGGQRGEAEAARSQT